MPREADKPLDDRREEETTLAVDLTVEEDEQIIEGGATVGKNGIEPEMDSDQVPGEEPVGAAFPLEIEHEQVEVSPDEAMAAGWPGAPLPEDEQEEAAAFPIEVLQERGNVLLALEGETGTTSLAAEVDGEEEKERAGVVELAAPFVTTSEQAPGEIMGAIELAPEVVTAAEPELEENGGDAELAPRGAVSIEPVPGELIGAVELVARGAASTEPEPGELISSVELVHFMTEAAETQSTSAELAAETAVETAQTAHATERRHVVKSAALVSIGNLGSSLMGMVRQVVVTRLGSTVAGPFNAALAPANSFYQLLINGSVSGALVPTFNDYAAPEKREEMRRVVFTVLNLILLLALVSSIGYVFIAPWLVPHLVPGYPPASKLLTLRYSQIIFFSLVALGPFSVLLSALFALKEFGWPAFATAAYHVGIILGAIGLSTFGSFYWGPMALPVGVLLGAIGEIVLLLPGIRRQHFHYMFVLDLKHPALRRIIKLYVPILVSYAFSTAAILVDVSLWASAKGNVTANTVAQANATALLQFPIGLVAMALGAAVLPTLTEHAREGNGERFKSALLLGFRVGLLLMIPAMVGMWVLRLPIVDLLFSHRASGHSGLADASLGAIALQNYSYQLPFVAIDQLLISAFYARKNTLTPVVVGIVCIAFYLAVALPFYRTVGIAALAFANTVQNSMHGIILLILLRRAIGSLHIRQTIPAILKISVAAVVMGVVTWGVLKLLGHFSIFSLSHLTGQLLTVIIAGSLAAVVYIGGVLLFKVEEINLVKGALLAKLGKK